MVGTNEFDGRLKILGMLILLVIVAILIARIGYLQIYDGELLCRVGRWQPYPPDTVDGSARELFMTVMVKCW